MYIFFLSLVVIYLAVTAILDAQKTKKLIEVPITEKGRVKFYIDTIIFGWASVLAVMIMCFIADINLADIGLQQITLDYNIWFTAIIFVLCGVLFFNFLYQIIGYLTSAKYREAIRDKLANDKDKSYYDTISTSLMIPRSKKEKRVFFLVSLTAGIGEEILLRGFLFFLLQAIFPDISVIFVVLISSGLFGIWHLYQGVQGVIITSIAGALFGCLFLVTGSLIPGIMLHFFVDFSSVFLLSEEQT